MGAASTPATPARATPEPYVSVTMRGTLTPKACTSAGFSVAARRYEPSLVRSMTYQVARHRPSEKTMTQAVEPPDHGPLEYYAEKSDDNRREDERPPVAEPGPLEEEVRHEGPHHV